jgi:hypothetical protein
MGSEEQEELWEETDVERLGCQMTLLRGKFLMKKKKRLLASLYRLKGSRHCKFFQNFL